MKEKVLKALEVQGDLPPLPDILIRLEGKINDPACDLEDIAAIIDSEPVLSGRLLTMANSVFFGGGREKAGDLSTALLRLGLKMVLDLAYTLKLPGLFKGFRAFNQLEFWRHSLAVAFLTRSLGARAVAEREKQDISYLAGLMHDVGILVFDYLIPQEYETFLKKSSSLEKPLEELEMEEFGIANPELGARFLEKWWPVPEAVPQAIREHHSAATNLKKPVSVPVLINIANKLANQGQLGLPLTASLELPEEGLGEFLGLSLEEIERLLEETREGLKQVEGILKV